MEASKKLKTVADMLADFKARYPRERFIWVNAPLETAGEWPEHYGLGARVFKVPTDNLKGTPPQNGWIYELHGLYAFSKASKLQIMHDAGVIFSRDQFRRIDDGADSDVCEMEGSAAILSLSGLSSVTGRKRIDRKITPKVSREFLIENCETKLELRLGWKLVGLPQAFTMEELKAKEFVTFCVFSAPHATNPEERMLILRHHLGIWGPAFGDAKPIEIGEVEAPKQIEGPQNGIDDAEIIPGEQGFPESALQDSSPEGAGDEKAHQAASSLPQNEPPPPSGSSKPTAEKIDFLQAVGKLKAELVELSGSDEGYYKVLLEIGGVQHANLLTDRAKQSKFYRKLESMIALLKENPQPKPPAKAFQEVLDMARGGYEKLAIEALVERIEAQMELQHYPIDQDPLGILGVLTQGDKAKCVEAAVALMERGLIETTKERDRKAADPRGGVR